MNVTPFKKPNEKDNDYISNELFIISRTKDLSPYDALAVFDLKANMKPVYECMQKIFDMDRAEVTKVIKQFNRTQKIVAEIGKVPETAIDFIEIVAEKWKLEISLKGEYKHKNDPYIETNGVKTFITDEDRRDKATDDYCRIKFPTSIRRDHIMQKLRLINDATSLNFSNQIIDDALCDWAYRSKLDRKNVLAGVIAYRKSAQKVGDENWNNLVSQIVDKDSSDPQVVKAVLQHFVWQVKRKFLDLQVNDHMMPVIMGPQGVGKSRLIENFIEPMKEASRGADFSQLTEDRNIELWDETFVMVLDEMAHSSRADIEKVKGIITASYLQRRPMGTNNISNIPQKATFIGTSNKSLSQLINDETGIRRFFPIYCTDEFDYETINNIDYLSMWQSVNEQAESPYAPYKREVSMAQEQERNMSSVEMWLRQIDKQNIETDVWVNSSDAYAHFKEWAQDNWSARQLSFDTVQSFGRELSNCVRNKLNVSKKRTKSGIEYMFKIPK